MLSASGTYQDDTARFLSDLQNGEPVSLLAAPAVVSHFDDYRRLFGYLQSLGVGSFHNVLLRADITLWAYDKLLRQQPHAGLIASPCAALSAYIRQRLPVLLPFLMPVHSPLLCSMIYLRKYKQVSGRLAFLSPCVAKRAEMCLAGQPGYNVTIGRLKQHLAAAGVDLTNYPPVDFSDRGEGGGRTLGAYGGLCEAVAPHLPDGEFVKRSGPGIYPWLKDYARSVKSGHKLPTLLELYNCCGGCDNGPGTGRRQAHAGAAALKKPGVTPDPQLTMNLFARFDRELCLDDFLCQPEWQQNKM
ncbi:MAG: [Fe-Fe] hydrogenase large subunit C-terminal domain-containing protein [Sporomusaceae bacterium]|nr:[Fe-Fe] hydrogenase large subunit C-terminal domain-containing protein [Sporomusaceae bacterium]